MLESSNVAKAECSGKKKGRSKKIAFDELLNTGIGDMQMSPTVFWYEYTLSDFQRKAFYFFRNREDDFKNKWNQIQRLAHVNALVAGAKVEANEVLPLPWSEEVEVPGKKPITAEEGASIIDRYAKMGLLNKHKLN